MSALDGRVGSLESRFDGLEARVGGLEANMQQLRRETRRGFEGSAIAMAMAGATLPPMKNFAVSANWGTFRGENGFAATGVARITDNVYAHGGIGFGTNRGGVGGRAGVTYAW
jgi:hypothetical protein